MSPRGSLKRWFPALLAACLVVLLLAQWKESVDLREVKRGIPGVAREWKEVRNRGEEQLEALRRSIRRHSEAHPRDG